MMTIHYIAMAGLAILLLGWALQYGRMRKNDHLITREFTGMAALGMMMLIMDSIQNGLYDTGLAYILVLAVTMLVFFQTKE